MCHVCGTRHDGGINNFHQISDTVRANIKKLVKAGTFDGNNDDATKTTSARKPTKKKQGTTNTVVEEEDNGEDTEVGEDGFPPCEHLLQMLGMSNTLIGYVNNTEEPTTKASGCWDGDTFANLGFTNLQIGGYRL